MNDPVLQSSPGAEIIKSVKTCMQEKYLVAVFLSLANMKRGERQPMASHGEILHEKLAPYMLFLVLSLFPLFGWAQHSAANFFNLSSASFSPPTREALITGLPS